MKGGNQIQIEIDRRVTLENREKLTRNRNLLHWYAELYRHQFAAIPEFAHKRVLEIGSGTSPMKQLHPHVITSDVLDLDYLDFVFDCHEIDEFDAIPDASLDVITLTNVLHHLTDPVRFLKNAAVKLKAGGQLIATESYFSVLSGWIYRHLHHEPVDFQIAEPKLASFEGPLASANIALPFLMFRKRPEWLAPINGLYEIEPGLRPFTTLSYMASGGISRRIPIPGPLYRLFFPLDRRIAEWVPELFASFFTVILRRSGGGMDGGEGDLGQPGIESGSASLARRRSRHERIHDDE